MVIPADADEPVTSHDIAKKYGANEGNVAYWATLPGFPEAWPSGPGRTLVRDAAAVDKWLKENLPVYWAKGQDSDNPFGLPAGGPRDLVTLSDICAWEGQALGRAEPVPEATLRSYISRKVLPGPDRTPRDGKQPEVTERKWFRETAYKFVNRPRRRMRRQTKADTPAGTRQAPAADSLPASRSSAARLNPQAIATTFSVSGQTARGWTRAEGFPRPDDDGRYPADDVHRWVRANRSRSWAAAQRRGELAGRAPAPSAAVASSPPLTSSAEASGKSIQGEHGELPEEMIGPRYGRNEATAQMWINGEERRRDGAEGQGFPAPLHAGRPNIYDARSVDAWVRENQPEVWAASRGTELTPELIGLRYGQPERMGRGWTGAEEEVNGDTIVQDAFPRPLQPARPALYAARSVDAWVEKNRPGIWASSKNTPRPEEDELTADEIGRRYRRTGDAASKWPDLKEKRKGGEVVQEAFPEPLQPARPATYDAEAVDAWVKKNRPDVWAACHESGQTDDDELTADMIGPRFNQPVQTGKAWINNSEQSAFPQPCKPARSAIYDTEAVDAWVKKNRPKAWANRSGVKPPMATALPEGDPLDLLDIYDFAEILGMATRGEPLARETIHAYHSRGQIPYADRTSRDGKQPRVLADHWYRRTIYDFVLSRRGAGETEGGE
ncbi:hypothetical protein [Streptomyces sp. NPDC059611]|uniref:hypothetical protein n=1 Tax=Streptomyces sp. NPDC059611 TaxID=3346884 RepID=UPI0036B0ECAF